MTLTYDASANALYCRLAGGSVTRTVEIDDSTNADLGSDGRLLGIEVLNPGSAWPLAEVLRRFEIADSDAHMLMCGYPFSFAWMVSR